MIAGGEHVLTAEVSIPCFRCGICCTRYQPSLRQEDIENIASALGMSKPEFTSEYTERVSTKEGYLLKRTERGCVFLARDEDGRARCTIYPYRPEACHEWTPTLSRPECLEGLAKLGSKDDQEGFCSSLRGKSPGDAGR